MNHNQQRPDCPPNCKLCQEDDRDELREEEDYDDEEY